MNLTEKGKFQLGNTIAKHKSGKKHKSTLLKEKLGINNLYDLEKDLIKGWYELLHSSNKTDKRFALKEISRYVFPVRKEIRESIVCDERELIKSIENRLGLSDLRHAKH